MSETETAFDKSYDKEEKKFTQQLYPAFQELNDEELKEFHSQAKIIQAERFLSTISLTGGNIVTQDDVTGLVRSHNNKYSDSILSSDTNTFRKEKWESYTFVTNKDLLNPVYTTSILALIPDGDDEEDETLIRKQKNPYENYIYKTTVKERGDVLKQEDPGISYKKDLIPYLLYRGKNRDIFDEEYAYLDNASIQYNKFDCILQFPGMVTTIIPYIPEKKLKLELNQQFHVIYPRIQKSFSLTKLRTLKKKAMILCEISEHLQQSDSYITYDAGTMGLAFSYFERLVLDTYVTKENRNLYMCICIVLAFKFAQQREIDDIKDPLSILFYHLETIFGVNKESIVSSEITIFSQLHFSLHRPLNEFMKHVNYIYKELETNIINDIGVNMHNYYLQTYNFATELIQSSSNESDSNYE